MPALQRYIIKPTWKQLKALLAERRTNHPLGYHRPSEAIIIVRRLIREGWTRYYRWETRPSRRTHHLWTEALRWDRRDIVVSSLPVKLLIEHSIGVRPSNVWFPGASLGHRSKFL